MDLQSSTKSYTPLDLNRLNERYNKPPHHISYANIILIIAVSSLILSMAYLVQTQRTVRNTQASPQITQSLQPTPQEVVDTYPYPKTYKGKVIPESYHTTAADSQIPQGFQRGQYIEETIKKYYIYKDVLTENALENKTTPAQDFTGLQDAVTHMEQQISQNLISTGSFGFIFARFDTFKNANVVHTKFVEPQEVANQFIEQYRQNLLSNEYSIEQMVAQANQDETLTTLNEGFKNAVIENYDSSKNPFPEDPTFEEFIFTNQPDQISDTYTLKDTAGNAFGYVILYVKDIKQKKYASLKKILDSYSQNFMY